MTRSTHARSSIVPTDPFRQFRTVLRRWEKSARTTFAYKIRLLMGNIGSRGIILTTVECTCGLGEKQNVATSHPELVARIEAYLSNARTESAEWPIGKGKAD